MDWGFMITEAINKLMSLESLDFNESTEVMTKIMTGEVSEVQLSAFLTSLQMKGATSDEIAGMATITKQINFLAAPELVVVLMYLKVLV